MTRGFTHVDGDQRIVFGPDALDAAAELVPDGYALLTTARASRSAPAFAERAAVVVEVPAGAVDVVAAGLRDAHGGRRLVALGGGRVVDVAKALAAADGLPGPVAVPTSLSGAEMTGVHRHARGVPADTPRSRASLVLNAPSLSASQPTEDLAASSGNALGHAVTAASSPRSGPLARAVAREAIDHLGRAWSGEEPDRDEVALGALLAGWSVDRSGLGVHHALAQTAVRTAELSHAGTNVALLPHTVRALRERLPREVEAAGAALPGTVEDLAGDLHRRAGSPGLGALASDDALLDEAVATAAGRAELQDVPSPLTADDVRELYLRAARG
ncbi:iron-containing alcohol dehydrogenase [Patulibacter sp.]|uniref:iron-containing alcohol dehydrogenase n=1 Tax=Patulibacter sp. TaxID=1912859 RepID=UPI002716D0C0|nr:iron-containing alcohol dehydrogenase [Patulibacter sp.]MDO9409420.1 iron-containing alcohol dehydrogenase [Patulibacter sp.]